MTALWSDHGFLSFSSLRGTRTWVLGTSLRNSIQTTLALSSLDEFFPRIALRELCMYHNISHVYEPGESTDFVLKAR